MNNNKKILIGVGVLAAVGLAYYLWKKDKAEDTTEKTGGEKKPEEKKVSATGVTSSSVSNRGLRVGIVSKTIGSPDASHGNKCYCGQDDSIPKKDIWNFACCDKAPNKIVTRTPILDTLTKNTDLGTMASTSKVSPSIITPITVGRIALSEGTGVRNEKDTGSRYNTVKK